jgi:GTP cyclohydrolase I
MENQSTNSQMDEHQIIRKFLEIIGENPDREGLLDTPKRVVKSWKELYKGYQQDPKEILSTFFKDGTCEEMVILKDIEFSSMCEHHVLPFIGKAHIGYLPNGKVIGLSKLARLVDCFAKRLQIQEKMTQQISKAINENLSPLGVAVVIEAHHQCMSCRGVGKQNSVMITSSMLGKFKTESIVRSEFLSLI